MTNNSDEYFRIDLINEVVSFDDETQVATMIVRPDPERYEKFQEDGIIYYRDMYTEHIFEESLLYKTLAKETKGMPVSAQFNHIENSDEYSKNRKISISNSFQDGKYNPPIYKGRKNKQLEVSNQKFMSFVSVDICDSTKLREAYKNDYDKVYDIFLKEVGTIAGQFNCDILKFTGDGMIIYSDFESTNCQADSIIDLSMTIIKVVTNAINNSALEAKLPTLNVRVGAESGLAEVKNFTVENMSFSQNDINSDALNKAVKIQEKALPNTVLIGQGLYNKLHVQWLKRCKKIKIDADKNNYYEVY